MKILKDKKSKEKFQKKKILKITSIMVIVAITIYLTVMIYGLIKEPTNVFVVENGKISLEEDAVRICYS